LPDNVVKLRQTSRILLGLNSAISMLRFFPRIVSPRFLMSHDQFQHRLRSGGAHYGGEQVARSAASGVGHLFANQVCLSAQHIAIQDGDRHITYTDLDLRVRQLASVLRERGVARGDRIAILSENRVEYFETYLAAAYLGAIVACQNWRLSSSELAHCLNLVRPQILLVSPRHAEKVADRDRLVFGAGYEAALSAAEPLSELQDIDPEDALLVLYTSGTTGLPKGAVISHRAEIARNLVIRAEFGVAIRDTFVAWSPLYHMGAAECSLGTLMCGGKVIIVDGFDHAQMCHVVAEEELGWLLLMPGMVGEFATELAARQVTPRGVKVCGVMADLVPPHAIAEITAILDAPYANTFGATETGCPPCSSNLLPIGIAPVSLSKSQSPFCEIKLVNADGEVVEEGQPGELCMRGPTLFSGYWNEAVINAEEFRGGWFHMGDVFRRNPNGSLDFVDRVKYLIKSGGENIYPAEIERVLLSDPRVAEAAVVKAQDDKWGEVPIAFIACHDPAVTEAELYARCRAELAGYKQPKGMRFMDIERFPRSASGKIQRHELEKLL
jgi:fatty-acyl-CoA synthase